jgi:Leucine-rich repeat (LRR) protein
MAISNLPSLTNLYILGNRLQRFYFSELNNSPNLNVLNIVDNQITNFSWIGDFPKLRLLSVDAKSSLHLTPSRFKESKLLSNLELCNVDDFIFQNFCSYLDNLPSLGNLDFSKPSEVSSISSNAFDCNNRLTHLSIRNTRLTSITNSFLTRFTRLITLRLWYNRLDHLDTNVFQGAFKLTRIDLFGKRLNNTYTKVSYYNFTGFSMIPTMQF